MAISAKDVSDVTTYTIDLSDEIAVISDTSVSTTNPPVYTVAEGGWTVLSSSIGTDSISVQMQGGTDGTTGKLDCLVTYAPSETEVRQYRLEVKIKAVARRLT